MKNILALLLLPLSLNSAANACYLPVDRPLSINNLSRSAIDTAGFINDVVNDLDDDYMGYSAILVGKKGRIIADAKYGYARTPCEAEGVRNFNHNTQTAWGSVTKVLTTALVIDKVERSTQSLNEKMWENLPAAWRSEMQADSSPHMAVEIRDLLSHRSGFAGSSPLSLRERVNEESLEKTLSSRIYSNANFAIFHHMGRFFRESYFDNLEASFLPGEIPLDDYLKVTSINIYKTAFQNRIANKIGINFSCNTSDYAGNNYSRYYRGPNTEQGFFLNPYDYTGCATGGIVMSPRDMAKFLYALTRTDDIIRKTNYQNEMAIASIQRLGWDYADIVVGGRMFGKNGIRRLSGGVYMVGNPSGNSRAEIVAFPNGMSALIVANSPRPNGAPTFRQILRNAYNANVTP